MMTKLLKAEERNARKWGFRRTLSQSKGIQRNKLDGRRSLLQRLRLRKRRLPTLRRRIIGAFSIVVALSIVLMVGVAYISTVNGFSEQSQQTSLIIARQVSSYISEQYAVHGSWDEIDPMAGIIDSPAAAFIGQPASPEELARLHVELAQLDTEWALLEEARAALHESYNVDIRSAGEEQVDIVEERLIVAQEELDSAQERIMDIRDDLEATIAELSESSGLRGLNMRVDTYDASSIQQWRWESVSNGLFSIDESFGFESRSDSSLPFTFVNAPAMPIINLATGEEVGIVYVSVTDDYFGLQRVDFLDELLLSILLGSVAVGLVSLLLGSWLAWRITAPVTALTRASKALADEGSANHLPVTSADELGQMSATFNQMVDKLQTQRKLRKRLLSDVSHELNTPLSVIQLEATGIKDGIQSPVDAADQIISEIGMLRNLVYDLNWLGETDVGEVRLNKSPQTIKRLLGSEVERWQGQARSEQITLRLQSLPSLPPIDVDALRMGQALGNLVGNALSHTPAGGEVTISAEIRPIHQAAGEWVVICVQDTGEGIDSAELHHVFERLYRTDEARTRQQGGRGLGLSITRQLVQLHGGHVWADSTIGEGSKFYIALPPME